MKTENPISSDTRTQSLPAVQSSDAYWRGRSVLITGATGFIGRNLAQILTREGAAVHALVRNAATAQQRLTGRQCTLHPYDGKLGSIVAALTQAQPDLVIHLATSYHVSHDAQALEDMLEANIAFGARLLQAIDQVQPAAGRLLSASTAFQHFENQAYSPVSFYAATKQAFDDLALYFCQARGLRWIRLELSDTYGPDDDRGKLFSLFERAAHSATPVPMSPGEQMLDLLHVDEVVDGFLVAGRRVLGEGGAGGEGGEGAQAWALRSGHPVSVRQAADAYARARGQSLNIDWGAQPYRPRTPMTVPDGTPVLAGWQPRYTLHEGIATM